MTSNQKVAVVTGTSSGIGHETSLALARSGFRTYATMSNLNKSENIKSVATKEKLPIHRYLSRTQYKQYYLKWGE